MESKEVKGLLTLVSVLIFLGFMLHQVGETWLKDQAQSSCSITEPRPLPQATEAVVGTAGQKEPVEGSYAY